MYVFVQTDPTGSENRDQFKVYRFIFSRNFTSQDPILDYFLTRCRSRADLSPNSKVRRACAEKSAILASELQLRHSHNARQDLKLNVSE